MGRLVRYRAAAGDLQRVDFGYLYARSVGSPTSSCTACSKPGGVPNVHRLLRAQALGQEGRHPVLVERGAPRTLDPPNVTNNHIKDGERLVELEVWAQNGNREVTP